MEINQAWIDEMRALCEVATPGSWNHSDWGSVLAFTDCEVCQNAVDADMTFISAVRTALPAALDEIERLAADNRKLREAHELAQSGYGTYAHTGNENAMQHENVAHDIEYFKAKIKMIEDEIAQDGEHNA